MDGARSSKHTAKHAHGSGGGFRFPVERLHLLKDPERSQRFPPEPILQAAGITAGDRVIDVGAGAGFWTLPLSKCVGPRGKVFAVDIEPVMLEELLTLKRNEGLENVEVVATQDELVMPLPEATADAAVLGFVLHEPVSPPLFLKELLRVLRSAAAVVVIDWHKRETESGPPVQHRISQEDAVKMLEDVGLRVQALGSPDPDVYVLLGETPMRNRGA